MLKRQLGELVHVGSDDILIREQPTRAHTKYMCVFTVLRS